MALAERRTLAIEAKLRDLLTGPLTKMEKNLSRFGVIAGRSLAAAGIAIGAMTTGAVVGFRALLRVADSLDQIAKASDNLGITAESLTAIRNGAALAGVSVDQLGAAMKAFEKVVAEANAGSEKQRDLLAALGLSAKDFRDNQLDIVDVLAQVADGLAGVDSAAARTRIIVDLFGKSGQQLGSLLKQGSAGIRQIEQDARNMGAVFSREELGRVEAFKDSWEALGQTFRTIVERLVVDLSPALTQFFDDLRRAVSGNLDQVQSSLLAFAETTANLLPILNRMAQGAALVFQGFQSIANVISLGIGKAFLDEGVVDELRRQTDERFAEIDRVFALANETSAALDKLKKQIRDIRREPGTLPAVTVEAEPFVDPPKPPKPTSIEKFFAGFNAQLEVTDDKITTVMEKWMDFTTAGKEAAISLIDGGLNELVNVLSEVGRSINSVSEFAEQFTRAFAADLQKVIAKMLVMQSIQLLGFGAEDGGVLPAMARGGIKRYAGGGLNRNGGIANRPTVLFGEGRTAEAFVPLPDNRSIPVSFVGDGPMGGSSFNFYITAMDSKDVQRVLVEEQNTLRAIWQNQVETRVGVRRSIQRVR